MNTVTIALAKDVEELLQEQVRAGVCQPFEITPEFEAWLLQSAGQPATALTKADFDGIRRRVRVRAKTPSACSNHHNKLKDLRCRMADSVPR